MSEKFNTLSGTIQLLKDWYVRIRIAQKGHYQDASQLKRRNRLLGIPVVILTTIVGAGVFASIEKDPSIYAQLATGLLSLLAATLASLQTFLNYAEKSEKHLNAARKLSGLKKEIEETLIIQMDDKERIMEFVPYVRKIWEEITNEAPLISEKNFKTNFEKLRGNERFPEMNGK